MQEELRLTRFYGGLAHVATAIGTALFVVLAFIVAAALLDAATYSTPGQSGTRSLVNQIRIGWNTKTLSDSELLSTTSFMII